MATKREGVMFTPPQTLVVPKLVPATADLYGQIRAARLELDHESARLKAMETALKEHLVRELPKGQATGTRGRLYGVWIDTKPVPVAEDWAKTYKWIYKHEAADILQRRLSVEAVQSRWTAKQTISGVGVYNEVVVHLNKV